MSVLLRRIVFDNHANLVIGRATIVALLGNDDMTAGYSLLLGVVAT